VVVGIGNLLLKDEGIGVHVARALQEMDMAEAVDLQIVDGGTSPDVLLSSERIDKLVIVDAARGSCEPGTVYRLQPEDIPQEDIGVNSLHQVNLSQSLRILDHLGLKPKDIVIFGVEPKEIDWGLEPSVELIQKIPEVVKLVLEEVKKC